MVMGQLAHLWAPDEIENCKLRRPVEDVDTGTPWLPKGVKYLCRSANGGGYSFKHTG
jgi:hypothetical protein